MPFKLVLKFSTASLYLPWHGWPWQNISKDVYMGGGQRAVFMVQEKNRFYRKSSPNAPETSVQAKSISLYV